MSTKPSFVFGKWGKWSIGVWSALLLLSLLGAPRTADARQRSGAAIATLSELHGAVTLLSAAGKTQQATVGTKLKAGSRIRTASGARAAVTFDDGTIMRVRPGTSLQISPHRRKRRDKNSVLLFFGRVWSSVSKRNADVIAYEVTSPNAVAGVRGTEFETGVGDDGSLLVRVSEGTVEVDDQLSGATSATAGEQVEANERGVTAAAPVSRPTLVDVSASGGAAAASDPDSDWAAWNTGCSARLASRPREVMDGQRTKVDVRHRQLATLTDQLGSLKQRRLAAQRRLEMSDGMDKTARQNVDDLGDEMAAVSDAIADLGDGVEASFGLVDHLADLADDPRFSGIDRKYLKTQAQSLRRIRKSLDKLVREGVDISLATMNRELDDFSRGRRNTLKEKKGSAMDEMFGPKKTGKGRRRLDIDRDR